jgi:hypothetical protein
MTKTDMRFVKISKVVYVRKEDIVNYLLEMAVCEPNNETPHDAGLRLEEAARLLGGIGL